MINKNKYIGKVFVLNKGITATVINYEGSKNVDVMLSNGIVLKKLTINNLENKMVANPMEKTILGVGYTGIYKENKLRKQAYSAWLSMIKRCYGGLEVNYLDCTVSEEWHNFSNFLDWYSVSYFKGCCVDKDLKIKGNRIYSKDNCLLVPKEINNLIVNNKRKNNRFIGVRKSFDKFVSYFNNEYIGSFITEIEAFLCYKKIREEFIKDISLLYYSNGLISTECYDSLNKWKIELND